jgi:hypothetical protein
VKPSFTQFTEFPFHVTIVEETSAAHAYISSTLFITVNENMKHTSERSYGNRNMKRTKPITSVASAIAVKHKQYQRKCIVMQLVTCCLCANLHASCYQHVLSGPGKLISVIRGIPCMKHAEAYTRRDVNSEISGSHSRMYEDDSHLRYYTMQSHISTPDISRGAHCLHHHSDGIFQEALFLRCDEV